MVGAERRPEPLVAQPFEAFPARHTGVALDIVPLLGGTSEMERGEPHLVAVGSALGAEEPVASVEPAQRIVLDIIDREGQLVISACDIVVLLRAPAPAGRVEAGVACAWGLTAVAPA